MKIRNNKTLMQYGTVFSFDIISKIMAALCTVLVIHMLNTQAYAEYTLFNSIASIVSSMIGSGITTGFLRMSVKNRSLGNGTDGGYYTVSFSAVLALTIVLFLGRSIISVIYATNGRLVSFSIVEAAIISLCQLNVYVFQSREKFGVAGKIYNLRNAVFFIFLIIVYLVGIRDNAVIIMIGTIVAGTLAIGLSFAFFRQAKGFSFPCFDIKRKEIIQLFFEIRWLVLYFAILALINAMDVIVLNRYTNDYYVANYGVAYKYYILLLSLLPSITAILRVKTSTKEYEESVEKRQAFIKNWIKKTGILSVIALAIIPLASRLIWNVLNGSDYELAYFCFVIFIIGASLSYMFSPIINFVLAANLHIRLCSVSLLALIFNIVGNYFLARKYAAIGVTVTTVISQAIINLGGTVILLYNDRKVRQRNEEV